MTARASDSMFYPLIMCALQIVFMIMIIKPGMETKLLIQLRSAYIVVSRLTTVGAKRPCTG